MTNTKLVVGSVLVAATLTTPLLMQQRTIANARAEQAALLVRQQETSLQTEPVNSSAAQLADADNAQRDRANLERLRLETAAMQARISELATQAQNITQNQRSATTKSSQTSGGTLIGQTFRLAEARDVGQATPAALVQTLFWTALQRDTIRFTNLIAFESGMDMQTAQKMFKDMQDTFGSDFRESAQNEQSQVRLLEEQPAENNDRWIVGEKVTPDGIGHDRARLRVTWSANGWRMLIGTNGEPVGGPIPEQP